MERVDCKTKAVTSLFFFWECLQALKIREGKCVKSSKNGQNNGEGLCAYTSAWI